MRIAFDWFADPLYIEWLLRGIVTTIEISALAMVFMLGIGVLGAYILHHRIRFVAPLVTVLVELFRNTPPLVQLFLLYFTLPDLGITVKSIVTHQDVPLFNGFVCVVISLSLYNGALAVEIIRSGLASVPEATIEAARSLGYGRNQIFRQVELPIGIRLSFSSMINNVVSLIKTSSQASLVAVGDIMFFANQIALETFRNFEVMLVILALYLAIVSLTVLAARRIEIRLLMHGYGRQTA